MASVHRNQLSTYTLSSKKKMLKDFQDYVPVQKSTSMAHSPQLNKLKRKPGVDLGIEKKAPPPNLRASEM